MHGYFFTHTVWYLLLALFSIAAFTAAIIKSDNRKFTLAFTLAVVGLFYIFEYTLVMTDAYSYSPKVFNEPFLDTVLGNIFSQTSIASITAFIIAYRLKWFWYFVFAAAYYGIERLFVGLGIFETYWYKTIYTPLILVPSSGCW